MSLFEPTLEAAHARLSAVNPDAYARTRNALNGAVTRLSPLVAGSVDARVLCSVSPARFAGSSFTCAEHLNVRAPGRTP